MYLSALQTQIPGHFSKWLLLPTPVRLARYNCSKSLLTDTLFIQTALPSLQTISRDNAVWASHPPWESLCFKEGEMKAWSFALGHRASPQQSKY